MLDLKRLRILREVAARGSFSAAAESLYVSQSAVSQQIAALEAESGVQLLLRLKGGPVLTEAGELLVSHADAAICRLEQAERELAELSGLGAGELRLISFPSASATIVGEAAARVRQAAPGGSSDADRGRARGLDSAAQARRPRSRARLRLRAASVRDEPDLDADPAADRGDARRALRRSSLAGAGADRALRAGRRAVAVRDQRRLLPRAHDRQLPPQRLRARVAFESNDYNVISQPCRRRDGRDPAARSRARPPQPRGRGPPRGPGGTDPTGLGRDARGRLPQRRDRGDDRGARPRQRRTSERSGSSPPEAPGPQPRTRRSISAASTPGGVQPGPW